MNTEAIYEMSSVRYTHGELAATIEAEAATLPPETWRSSEWDLNDYMIEAGQAGIISRIDADHYYDEPDLV